MSVFKYKNYKGFLKHYISQLPKKGRGEINKIATYLSVSSTLISQILAGEKDFSIEQAKGITEYLGLSDIDADYFILLVQRDRAGTVSLKNYYEQKISSVREKALKVADRISVTRTLTDLERSVFYSSFMYASVWLYTSTSEKGRSIDEVMNHFSLSRNKALEIIKFLHESQLCTESNGYYKMGTQSTHVEKGSPYLLHHYRNWRIKAIEQSENLRDEELMYSAAVSLSRKDFDHLREEMVQFIKEFLGKTHESPAEDIAFLNLDFMWIRK